MRGSTQGGHVIPHFVALSPIFAPLLLEALGRRVGRPASRLVGSFAVVAAASLVALHFVGPIAALATGAGAAALLYMRSHGASLLGATIDVALVSLFTSVVLLAAHMVVASPSLSLTTLGTALGMIGVFLIRGGLVALSGVGR
jgi:hypothetical protein